MNSPSRRRITATLPVLLLTGCSHPVAKTGAVPRAPPPAPAPVPSAPVPSAPAPIVLTTYPAHQSLPPGRQTRSLPLTAITPGDNSVPVAGGPPPGAQGQTVIAQGRVSLDGYQFRITPDGAGGSTLDGSATVHNHGPYDITDFQVSLREGGRLYVLIPPGGGHQISPAQGTLYTIHSAVPLSVDQLKTGKSFLLEAQLDGPPGLATDEETGTTVFDTAPGPPRH